MPFLLTRLAVLGSFAGLLLAAGLPWARRLGCAEGSDRTAWGLSLGFLIWAQLLHGTALLGQLGRPALAVLVVGVGLFGGRDLVRFVAAGARRLRAVRRSRLLLAMVLAVPFVLWVLYPPHAWDETIYHLVFARSFAASGSLPFLEQVRAPVFPPLDELLEAGILLVANDVDTHWVSFLATLATAGLLATSARRMDGEGPGLPRIGLGAAALYLGTPLVVYLAGVGYVDPLLTLLVTAAILALHRALPRSSMAWLAVAALAAGSAAGVKYLGLFFVGWLGLEALVRWPGDLRRKGRALTVWTLAAGGSAVAVYARIFLMAGNPLLPFYPRVFGFSAWAYEYPPTAGMSTLGRLWNAWLLPWRSVFERAAVGELPPLSPFWLALAAVAVVGAWRVRRWRWALAMSAVYLLVIPPHSRYFLPAVPVLGLAGFDTLCGRPLRPRAALVLALVPPLLLLAGWIYAGSLCVRRGVLPADGAAREAFLSRQLECYGAVATLNRTHGHGYAAYGMHLERLAGLAEGTWFGDVAGPYAFERVRREFAAPEILAADLATAGIQYLVLPEHLEPRDAFAGSPRLRRVSSDAGCAIWQVVAAPTR